MWMAAWSACYRHALARTKRICILNPLRGGRSLDCPLLLLSKAETLGQNSGINAIKNVTDRAKELGAGAVNRATGGSIDPDTTVAKAYPNTNTVEFRVATLEQLNKMYASLLKAWQDGKGRTFRP